MMERHGLAKEMWMIVPISHAVLLAVILHYGIEKKLNYFIKKTK